MRPNWLLLIGLSLIGTPLVARAESADAKLAAFEAEARQIGADLPELNKLTMKASQRRLVDAEVAFSLGDYNNAALLLFEIATQPGNDQERAQFYLAEALFFKGDKGAARTYYSQVVAKNNTSGRYHQAALVRLVEVAIAQQDSTDIDATLNALSSGSAETPYVKGKYAFSQDKHDEAISFFGQVAKGSEHELAALYFTGTAYVAKKDVTRATEIFTDVAARKPKTANERRVIELSQMALGRLYYERDQPAKAIESYLLVDRKSDLFTDSLYEIAWVYVKGKQFDKALRALELLHLSDPVSNKTPTVRILEGNLRIRKAQLIRKATIEGSLERQTTTAAAEYDKAAGVFADAHDAYMPSYQALSALADSAADPAQYLAQLAGRSPQVFQAAAPLPEAAAQSLREEPEVTRVVNVAQDLGDVEANLKATDAMIVRLEAVLAANDRNAVYPQMQNRRSRLGQIQHEVIKIRADIADQQLKRTSGGEATNQRKALLAEYSAMPNPEQAFADRVTKTHQEYDGRDKALNEATVALDSAQAVAVALRKYTIDGKPALADDVKATVQTGLTEAANEAAQIDAEIQAINAEITLGRDLAAVGDESLTKARELRKQIKTAQDNEHRAIASSGSADQRLTALGDRAQRLADSLVSSETTIDGMIDRGMEQVRVALQQEKQNSAQYKQELVENDAEARSIGGTVLGASFKGVKAKFYDIVVRTDVGAVDVMWSQKEDSDDDLKRLNLSRQRDLKQLKDEFKGVLEGNQPKQVKPPKPPTADPSNPTGSPDKGNGTTRVKPGGENTNTQQPVVKPDAKPAPKGNGK